MKNIQPKKLEIQEMGRREVLMSLPRLGKVKKAYDHDCLCMMKNFDSLEKVKKMDDHDCLCMTSDFNSLENNENRKP